jgi:murein DD-endopeptidase MepM/ murein hydrolase activator NlpD
LNPNPPLPLPPDAHRAQSLPKRQQGFKAFLFALALFIRPLAVAQDFDAREYPFLIEEIRSSQNIRFVAVNNSPAVLTVSFGVAGSNFEADKQLPVTLVVGPNSRQDIVQVSLPKRWEPSRFNFHYSFQPGDAFMLPDSQVRYRLPLAQGTRFLVVQGPDSALSAPGTLITHNNDHSRYDIDFGVPEGTPVTAAREGVVIDTKDTFTVGRPDPALSGKSNFVAIMHADRSIAHYAHLAPRGVLVKPGQQVSAGEVLAYSGNTGYTYGPHLHFGVRRAAISEGGEVVHLSIPVDFYPHDGADEKIFLEEGMLIKAQ